ncbi:hypothetical protein [Aneurinibacillus thermoaerophilus]|uniref:hypothetical protein n=1 Tax=Aneurinibacillus thermoaerophilus TaxID=143495 RepID=UPI001113BD15|nr:hypothetical protein [Aneurinibacillus thermoaerophilus]
MFKKMTGILVSRKKQYDISLYLFKRTVLLLICGKREERQWKEKGGGALLDARKNEQMLYKKAPTFSWPTSKRLILQFIAEQGDIRF